MLLICSARPIPSTGQSWWKPTSKCNIRLMRRDQTKLSSLPKKAWTVYHNSVCCTVLNCWVKMVPVISRTNQVAHFEHDPAQGNKIRGGQVPAPPIHWPELCWQTWHSCAVHCTLYTLYCTVYTTRKQPSSPGLEWVHKRKPRQELASVSTQTGAAGPHWTLQPIGHRGSRIHTYPIRKITNSKNIFLARYE